MDAPAEAVTTASPYRTPTGLPSAPRISGMHHTAWRCRDAAETRWFYETVCGLEMEAALAFKEAGYDTLPPLAIRLTNRIPIGAGLGSSSAAIVSGLV